MPQNPWGGPSWAAQSPAALGASGAVNAIVVGDAADDLCVFHALLHVSQPGWWALPAHRTKAAGSSRLPLAVGGDQNPLSPDVQSWSMLCAGAQHMLVPNK